MPKSKASERRDEIRNEHWPKEDYWQGQDEIGWFAAPRTLPLILSLLSNKEISGKRNPSSAYLELLSRQRGEGIVELVHEADHSYASGYKGPRAERSWQDQMNILKENGFIKVTKVGNRDRYVLIVHPTVVIEQLRKAKKVNDQWWRAYNDLKRDTKEPTFQQREDKKKKDEQALKEFLASAKPKPKPKKKQVQKRNGKKTLIK